MSFILWNTPYPVGGVTAFCVHLHKVTGWPILRMAMVSQRPRALGQWGVDYQNMTLDKILALDGPIILGGGSWTVESALWDVLLAQRNVWTVFHDETELKSMPHTRYINPGRVIVMREYNLTHYPRAQLLPQPYVMRYQDEGASAKRHMRAVCTARLDGIKGTEQILLANRLLHKSRQIQLWGAPNRLWCFGKKMKYPELSECRGFPPVFGAGADLHRQAIYGVDMTVIGNDGGVQYTLLESLDAGSIPVTTKQFHIPDVCGYIANTPQELAIAVGDLRPGAQWARANRAWLETRHGQALTQRLWSASVRPRTRARA